MDKAGIHVGTLFIFEHLYGFAHKYYSVYHYMRRTLFRQSHPSDRSIDDFCVVLVGLRKAMWVGSKSRTWPPSDAALSRRDGILTLALLRPSHCQVPDRDLLSCR